MLRRAISAIRGQSRRGSAPSIHLAKTSCHLRADDVLREVGVAPGHLLLDVPEIISSLNSLLNLSRCRSTRWPAPGLGTPSSYPPVVLARAAPRPLSWSAHRCTSMKGGFPLKAIRPGPPAAVHELRGTKLPDDQSRALCVIALSTQPAAASSTTGFPCSRIHALRTTAAGAMNPCNPMLPCTDALPCAIDRTIQLQEGHAVRSFQQKNPSHYMCSLHSALALIMTDPYAAVYHPSAQMLRPEH